MNKKILITALVGCSGMLLAACGPTKEPTKPTEPSQPTVKPTQPVDPTVPVDPYEIKTPENNVELTIALNYDGTNNRITYQQDADYTTPDGKTTIKKGDYKPVWSTIQTRLNMKATEIEKAVTSKAVTYFHDNWQTEQYADLAAANVTDVNNYSVLGNQETILDLSQYFDKLPNFKKFLDENPAVKQSITTAKHGDATKGAIYYFPYFDGYADLEKMTLVRADYVRKLFDTDVTLDEDATLVSVAKYQPTVVSGSNLANAYSVSVPKALDSKETKTITKASGVENIVSQQNALISAGKATSKALVAQFKEYFQRRYGTQFAKVSDLFLGVDSCYDADEMIALMRIIKASPKALTGDANKKMIAFVPREYNNQRIADLYRWAGQLWGVRGVESRTGYLSFDKSGKIVDLRGTNDAVGLLDKLNCLYQEGLILENFQNKAAAGVSDGKFAQGVIVGTGNSNYAGFMEYDYSQTQGVWNDKAASLAIPDYDFRPIMGGVANWDDGDEKTGYYHFTESWRSVKTQGLVLNAALKNDEAKLNRALLLCDFFWTNEGMWLNSYGPEAMGYTSGLFNYQGREIPKFTAKALEQLNDTNIGKGSYTDYLRKFVGATLPVGYIKEQGMEYQATSAHTIAGLDVINKGIELGTYKHVECNEVSNPFFKIVPSAFFLTSGQATTLSTLQTKTTLGSINSDGSTSQWNIWDNYVMYGWGNAQPETKTQQGYLSLVNGDWKLPEVVKVYQDAYDFMNA